MSKRKFKIWQVGWESESKEVVVAEDDCPACRVAGLPPAELDDPDPVVFGFSAEGSEVVEYRTIHYVSVGPMVARACYVSTGSDVRAAERVADLARRGEVEHWLNGVRHEGGVV